MADLDKAASKGWEMGVERKAMGNRKREWWKWEHGPEADKQSLNEKNAQKGKKLSQYKSSMDNVRQK